MAKVTAKAKMTKTKKIVVKKVAGAKDKKEIKEKIAPFKAQLIGEKVISTEKEAKQFCERYSFGELAEDKVKYSMVEALYLIEKNKIKLNLNKKILKFDEFLKKASELEPNFYTKFIVFRDMRNRGYIVKTALKFGADFRVYDKGVKPGEEHAKWILYAVNEGSILTWHEFAAKNRVAHSTRKHLLIGIVDDEGDVTYYEIAWRRP